MLLCALNAAAAKQAHRRPFVIGTHFDAALRGTSLFNEDVPTPTFRRNSVRVLTTGGRYGESGRDGWPRPNEMDDLFRRSRVLR